MFLVISVSFTASGTDTCDRMTCWLCAVNDTLDDILDESGDEEEQDAIVNQVLDEIGIEITDKVCFFFVCVCVCLSV